MHHDLVELTGAKEVIEWFGDWPSFHDAEVVQMEFRRDGLSTIAIHAFSVRAETNSRGQYKTDHHAIVTFTLGEILGMSLSHFNHQNVLSKLSVERAGEHIELILGGCYGLEGRLLTNHLSVSLIAGLPSGSVYTETL